MPEAAHPHRFDPTILREYDIRGIVGQTLHAADAFALGRCFAAIVRRAGGGKVAVGRDGRLSSPMLEHALTDGLRQGGVDVIRIGLAATPMLYYAEHALDALGAIQVTGSHNPIDHNGFKIVLAGRPFFSADIAALGPMAATGDWGPASAGAGRVEDVELLPAYVDRLIQGLAGAEPYSATLRIAWDAGNGAAGPAMERLTSLLPGEHHLLYAEVDGRFPNHHPDPTVEGNLSDLRALVAERQLDFGIAFDGDGDRIGVIDARGRIVDADQLLAIHARDVLRRHPGATVVADVKASQLVFDTVTALGGKAVMAPAGHSHIKARMHETGALLGGETSGHFFFADDYFGYDDGLYAAVRLIAACSRLDAGVTHLRDTMPAMHNTPELRFPVAADRKFAVIEEVRDRLSQTNAQVEGMDGVRVTAADGWWLLRASNTQEALTARAESNSPDGLARLVAEIDRQLALSGVSRT